MGFVDKLRETFSVWRQILLRTRKPMKDEFLSIFRVVLLAILLVGSVGFVIHLVARYALVR